MRHVWSVLCQSSITDKDTNNVSLLNVLEQLQFAFQPEEGAKGDVIIVPLDAVIVSMWIRSYLEQGEEAISRILLQFPDGSTTDEDQAKLVSLSLTDYQRLRYNYRIPSVLYKEDGSYNFLVQLKNETLDKWETVASLPLTLIRLPHPPDQEAS